MLLEKREDLRLSREEENVIYERATSRIKDQIQTAIRQITRQNPKSPQLTKLHNELYRLDFRNLGSLSDD